MSDYGHYRERSVKYGSSVRQFDDQASADEMDLCAAVSRYRYNDPNDPEWRKPRRAAEAAYCASLAERKRTWGGTGRWCDRDVD